MGVCPRASPNTGAAINIWPFHLIVNLATKPHEIPNAGTGEYLPVLPENSTLLTRIKPY